MRCNSVEWVLNKRWKAVAMRSKPMPRKVFTIAILLLLASNGSASTYFVAVNGSNANDGSKDHPWFSVKYALTRVVNNDTLYIREGVYYETGLSISNRSGILISAYGREKVEITGGVPDFRVAPNDKWELYDASTNLYRTKDMYPGTSYVSAWLLEDGIQLVQYASMANLQSKNYGPVSGFSPMYQGPGVLYSNTDGRIYMRLQNNPNDLIDPLGKPIDPIPADVDPNHHRVSISFSGTLFSLSNASNVKIKNLTLSYGKYLFDTPGASSNFEFDGCVFNYGIYAFVLRGNSTAPTARNYEIHHCDFSNGLPDYVYWCDVKNKDQEVGEAYSEFQSEAISGPAPDFYIHHNRFHDSFDAMDLKGGTENTRILYNEFYRLRDDAITLSIVKNVEIAHNIMWRVGEGVSCDFDIADTKTDGDVYVHHNIIDASQYQHGGRTGNYRASNWPVWQIIDAFGSHGDTYPAKWKVYNNTTVHRRSGYSYNPAELPAKVQSGPDLYVYNNIFLILDDRICFRGRLASSGAHFDGNVMYRLLDSTYHQPITSNFPLFYQFGNGSSFSTLAEFRSSSGTNWESKGLEIDPRMDVNKIVHGSYDGGEATWRRYFPRNNSILTQGVSYEGLNWPGTEGVRYRGAMADSLATAIDDRIPGRWNLPNEFSLGQNYPNPFYPTTQIQFSVAKPGSYSVTVFNVLGQEVAKLFAGDLSPGAYAVSFDAGCLSSGLYICTLFGSDARTAKKMMLLR
jgi:hypothetical protein